MPVSSPRARRLRRLKRQNTLLYRGYTQLAQDHMKLQELVAAAMRAQEPVSITDPSSEAGQQMIRDSASEQPLTQGDPPPPATDSMHGPHQPHLFGPTDGHVEECACSAWQHCTTTKPGVGYVPSV